MTMSLRPARHRYSYDEYLAYERDSGMKHEYDGGEIIAMAGGPRRHNALASRISAALENTRKPDCIAFQSDQRVRVLATGKATYPDASMVCGPLVGQSHARVERYRRLPAGGWEYHGVGEGAVHLLCGAVLDLAQLYTQLPD